VSPLPPLKLGPCADYLERAKTILKVWHRGFGMKIVIEVNRWNIWLISTFHRYVVLLKKKNISRIFFIFQQCPKHTNLQSHKMPKNTGSEQILLPFRNACKVECALEPVRKFWQRGSFGSCDLGDHRAKLICFSTNFSIVFSSWGSRLNQIFLEFPNGSFVL